MLGWHISIYKQTDGGSSPATPDSQEGTRLAVWQASCEGLVWLDKLVKKGHAIDLGGNGYPLHFTAQAMYLIPKIVGGPPKARSTWAYGPSDILTDKWEGKTVIDKAAFNACRPDEWLKIEAWDES